MMSKAACVPGRTFASTGASAQCSTTRPSVTAPKQAFGGRTAVKVRHHLSLPHCPLCVMEGTGRRPGLHGVSSVQVGLVPFPTASLLPSLFPAFLPPRVSVADHGAITPLFSARVGDGRRMPSGCLPTAKCDVELSWAEEGQGIGARCYPGRRGWPMSCLARVKGGGGHTCNEQLVAINSGNGKRQGEFY